MIEKLGSVFVRIATENASNTPTFLRVVTPSGKTGFVSVDSVAPIGNDQLCYVKEAGDWKIGGYSAPETYRKLHACEVLHTGRRARLIFELNFEFFEPSRSASCSFNPPRWRFEEPTRGGIMAADDKKTKWKRWRDCIAQCWQRCLDLALVLWIVRVPLCAVASAL